MTSDLMQIPGANSPGGLPKHTNLSVIKLNSQSGQVEWMQININSTGHIIFYSLMLNLHVHLNHTAISVSIYNDLQRHRPIEVWGPPPTRKNFKRRTWAHVCWGKLYVDAAPMHHNLSCCNKNNIKY